MIGFIVLAGGVIFYMLFRNPPYFLSLVNIHTVPLDHIAWGAVGSSLPSFVHAFSFSLITASLIKDSRLGYASVCIFWLTIDCIFELGQKYPPFGQGAGPSFFASIPFLENTGSFFLSGTFDVLDMLSTAAATLVAFYVLQITSERKERV